MFVLIAVSGFQEARTIPITGNSSPVILGSSAPKFEPVNRVAEALDRLYPNVSGQQRAIAEVRSMLQGSTPEIIQGSPATKDKKESGKGSATPEPKGGSPNRRPGSNDNSSGGGSNDGTNEKATGLSKNTEIFGAVAGAVLSAIGFGVTQMQREEWGMFGHAGRYGCAIAFMFFSMFGLGRALEVKAPTGALGSDNPM